MTRDKDNKTQTTEETPSSNRRDDEAEWNRSHNPIAPDPARELAQMSRRAIALPVRHGAHRRSSGEPAAAPSSRDTTPRHRRARRRRYRSFARTAEAYADRPLVVHARAHPPPRSAQHAAPLNPTRAPRPHRRRCRSGDAEQREARMPASAPSASARPGSPARRRRHDVADRAVHATTTAPRADRAGRRPCDADVAVRRWCDDGDADFTDRDCARALRRRRRRRDCAATRRRRRRRSRRCARHRDATSQSNGAPSTTMPTSPASTPVARTDLVRRRRAPREARKRTVDIGTRDIPPRGRHRPQHVIDRKDGIIF